MRIVGGRARGLKLAEVGAGDPRAHLRPTSDRVREAIFNLLVNGGYGNPLHGARVLDLFAGTGALGLEALSRGALHATFIENGKAALALLTRNIALMRAEAETAIHRRDALTPGPNPAAPFEVIFLDPPYGKAMGEAALQAVLAGGWIAPGALIVWEEGTPPALPDGVALEDQRKYGDTLVTIARAP
ncbi:16S rRNA (guanine(966)-N(2))-methyltransferase RsmD [Tabrizicola oligotrophica]|uniref:16S rRNA (Guanine(966)-N(2))-methyltransferase RsmD n=1 Tax=Tabrizicola oligotrophica TaxID=2710650 RepID=A0A6M0QU65_9RHOB|nr:16S rRNA (guanine(966)-N(2))-methyltransferase RsmD [Tabrizicola oligotrophica]NEY90002.1 16S rRNA (guanine(966)-N(2))-methyltransferase RsmD [Tabrizicola oligotrophica]